MLHCFSLHEKVFHEEYGAICGKQVIADLSRFVDKYNADHGICAITGAVGDNTYVAICTPLMARVHALWPTAKEMVFVDSSGGMDKQGCRVFIMLTHSPSGGLPLGMQCHVQYVT